MQKTRLRLLQTVMAGDMLALCRYIRRCYRLTLAASNSRQASRLEGLGLPADELTASAVVRPR
jgi:hypothetical protein